MVKSHPFILHNMFKQFNISCDELNSFVTNPDTFLSNNNIAKENFNIMINDSNYNTNNDKLININNKIYKDLLPSLLQNKEYQKLYTKICEDKVENQKGTFISLILQDIESKMIKYLYNELHDDKNIILKTYSYDGFLIYKKKKNNFINIEMSYPKEWDKVYEDLHNKTEFDDPDYLKWKNDFEYGVDHYNEKKKGHHKLESHLKIYREEFDDFKEPNSLLAFYAHDEKYKEYFQRWLRDPTCRIHSKHDFEPIDNYDKRIYNTIERFKILIDHICSDHSILNKDGENELSVAIIKWCANII